ncbi:Hpt domain-containing protein [Thermostichus vulcanus]|uniref:Hpt domain-containing protein n=1 Tax=Thermostichus vulcanus TaxID=32053 RepID=UPI003132C7BE
MLMDMQMPELNGISATRRIRAELSPERQPRIVALTANVLAESREAAEAAGVDDYLTKPLERAPLLRVLQGSVPQPSLFRSGSTVLSTVPAEDTPDAIDAATFNALRAVIGPEDQAVLQEMISIYLQEGQTQLGSLQKALSERDPQALFRLTHRFKGSSSTLGAKGLSQLCQEIEALTRTEPIDWNLTQSLLNQIQVEYQRVALSLAALTEPYLTPHSSPHADA